MGVLRDRTIGAERQQQNQQPPAARASGTTWAAPFATPLHGRVDGEPIRILAIGDMPGFSPVYLCVDDEGVSAPVRVSEVEITDGVALPLASGSRQRALANR